MPASTGRGGARSSRTSAEGRARSSRISAQGRARVPAQGRTRIRREPRLTPAQVAEHTPDSPENSAYDSEEDYDSDCDYTKPLAERAKSKMLSAIHAAWLDIADGDLNFPHDFDDYAIWEADPTTAGLATLLVEAGEALTWVAEDQGFVGQADVEALCHVFQNWTKHASGEDSRIIGPRVLYELLLVVETYLELYGEPARADELTSRARTRIPRTSSDHLFRAGRMRTVSTTGGALVVRLDTLKQSVEAALLICED